MHGGLIKSGLLFARIRVKSICSYSFLMCWVNWFFMKKKWFTTNMTIFILNYIVNFLCDFSMCETYICNFFVLNVLPWSGFFSLPDWVNNFAQESHLYLFCPSWMALIWFFFVMKCRIFHKNHICNFLSFMEIFDVNLHTS